MKKLGFKIDNLDYKTIVEEICHQTTSDNFQQIEPELKVLVGDLTNDECDQIVQTLTQVYREQRKHLENGNPKTVGNESGFPVWISAERPPTLVEEAMLRWLKSEDNPTAQMIGARLVLGEDINFHHPQAVLKILKLWYENIQTNPLESEALLTAIALIALEMQFHQTSITAETAQAFSYVHKIFIKKEQFLFARKSVVGAIFSQTEERLRLIKPRLMMLFPEFTDEEHHRIVAMFNQSEKTPEFLDISNVGIEEFSEPLLEDDNHTTIDVEVENILLDVASESEQKEELLTDKIPVLHRNDSRKNNRASNCIKAIVVFITFFLTSYFTASFVRKILAPMPTEITSPSVNVR